MTITASGPADTWFGIGLNAKLMSDQPYTIILNGSGFVFERQIGTCGSEAEHCPGDVLSTSVKMISNTVVKGVRTVVMTRAMQGISPKHYTFDPETQSTIHFISAVGSSQVFGYHKAHAPAVVTMIQVCMQPQN